MRVEIKGETAPFRHYDRATGLESIVERGFVRVRVGFETFKEPHLLPGERIQRTDIGQISIIKD